MPENTRREETKPAPCTRYETGFFFPAADSRHIEWPNADEQAALDVCATCPLVARRNCLEGELSYAVDKQFGVVGGATAAQRKAIIRGRKAAQLAGVAA
ncbi:WhiB family transcriptional regulator [Kitasatospora sp. GP82]|uniref:WhiB family transcriptional regulator n=1 Tax=Kitasatospora sp. GP82 TaxID=3035089 RepID=UPI002473EAFE|nr:WhiB family transcriptional regulator [Kitasatospora sp. GP82]